MSTHFQSSFGKSRWTVAECQFPVPRGLRTSIEIPNFNRHVFTISINILNVSNQLRRTETYVGGWGGENGVTPTGKSFRFVRACGRGEARRSCVGASCRPQLGPGEAQCPRRPVSKPCRENVIGCPGVVPGPETP